LATIFERGRPADILLIDDNPGDARLIEIAFKKANVSANVTIAETAEQGLKLLQGKASATGETCPDIIFLDLNLPSMHGLKFLELMKADPALTSIPVLVLSSSRAQKDIAESYNRHANGFVTKPSSLEGYLAFADSVSDYWFRLMQTPPNPCASGNIHFFGLE
jgi:CheY-like chemotaxis protein